MSKLLGVHIPADIKNIAINGNMDFWQRVESNSTTLTTNGSGGYIGADMFSTTVGGTTTKSVTVVRSTNVPSTALSNWTSTYSMQFTNNTAVPSLASGDYFQPFIYKMEGLDYQKIHGKVATFGFWFSTTLAGTYTFAIRGAAYARAYITTFNAVVGWQFVSITIQMDTATGYVFDTGIGIEVNIASLTGTTYQAAPSTSWQPVNTAATTATNWAATSGTVMNVVQFSAVEGPVGFGPRGFERAGDSIQAELALCQRYYEKSYNIGTAPGTANANYAILQRAYSSDFHLTQPLKVAKRIAPPTVLIYSPISGNSGTMRNVDGNSEIVATSGVVSTTMVDFYSSSAGGSGNLVSGHFICDAGL